MSERDATDGRVRALLIGAAAGAYLPPSRSEVYDPRRVCGCSHWPDAHHGQFGEGRCGEDGCDCAAWHVATIECPSCRADWSMADPACSACGLTAEALAEELARHHALMLARGEFR